jgi:hypothetical protein
MEKFCIIRTGKYFLNLKYCYFSGEKSQKIWRQKADYQNASQRPDRSRWMDSGTAHVSSYQGKYSQKIQLTSCSFYDVLIFPI